MSNLSTDGYRIKTITQKENGGNTTYPLGTDGLYVDMLSGLDLQEQLLLGTGFWQTDISLTEKQDFTLITETFRKEEAPYYQKRTRIYRQKIEDIAFIDNFTNLRPLAKDYNGTPTDYSDDDIFSVRSAVAGLGDVITELYRFEGDAWILIHSKVTIFSIDYQGNLTNITEYLDVPSSFDFPNTIDFATIDNSRVG